MFDISIKGLDMLIAAFDKAGVALPEQLQQAMVASVIDIKQTAQSLVPVRTSQLRTSITETVEANPLIGRVTVGQPYGKYVEFGTPAHVIVPVSAKALRFVMGGSVVFAKKVNHPGTAARPFMEPAIEQNIGNIKENFRKAVSLVLEQLGGT